MNDVIASMCFLITYMLPFSRSVWTMVEENSSGMASMLRSMGTSDLVYWLAHFVSTFVHVSFYSVMAVFFMVYNTYYLSLGAISYEDYEHTRDYAPYLSEKLTRRGLLIVLFTMFGVQTSLHAMLLSCVNTKPLMAMVLAAFYWTAMFAMSRPWSTLEDYLFDDRYPKYLAAMFPVNNLYVSFFHVRWTMYFGCKSTRRSGEAAGTLPQRRARRSEQIARTLA
ncbi:uncharacterized protein [Dermacentor andersoni]|uniref:uncharacterized protein n=1 Tax=Dermacentor andersoni TaxID=34620 RepID=UPI002415A7B0|nr:uncharacterized protein LOC126546125 [Dermacentor andersoni]